MCGFQVAQFFHVSLLKLADHFFLGGESTFHQIEVSTFFMGGKCGRSLQFWKESPGFIQDLVILVAFFGMVSSPSP